MGYMMWYVPAGVLETIGFGISLWLSYRLAKSLEIPDKDLNRYVYVRSEFREFEGWVRIDE